MAARSNDKEEEIWGTWEELILACLVERHGPHSWDSVATEIRSRSTFSHRLTPDTCRNRYHHLKNRFAHVGGTANGNLIGDDRKNNEIPWLDELRKLRVAELRHEVQRHDDSIGSLQLKVKKLKEERETGSELDTKEEESQSKKEIVGKIISDEDSGRSCKESNTTETKIIPDVKLDDKAKVDSNRAVNGSRSGSVNANPNRNGNESSSDVQSSLCRRRDGGGGSTSVSVVKKMDEVEVESQPLIAFLEIIKSSKDGLVFDKRLESQETSLYKNTVRRHVDLKTIQNRIRTVGYRRLEFFRDLLLLCNNAIVFYPRNSTESISAVRLRALINKEMTSKLHKTPRHSPQSQKEPIRLKATSAQPQKPALSAAPLVACSKRSSTKPVKKEGAEVAENGKEKKERKSRGPRSFKGRGKKAGPAMNPKPEPEITVQGVKVGNTKKRGMNFLNRLKGGPASTDENVGVNSKNGTGKKKGKEEGRKKEVGAKRNVGRPPKRGGKRGREEEKAESPMRRKRGRR